MLGCWNVAVLWFCPSVALSLSHHSIIPSFHHSNIPIFQYSNIPIFHHFSLCTDHFALCTINGTDPPFPCPTIPLPQSEARPEWNRGTQAPPNPCEFGYDELRTTNYERKVGHPSLTLPTKGA